MQKKMLQSNITHRDIFHKKGLTNFNLFQNFAIWIDRFLAQIMTFITIVPFKALISAVFLLHEIKILILFILSLQVDHYSILYLVSLTVVIRMAFEGHHPGPLQQRRQPLVFPHTCPYFIGLIRRLLLVLIASMVCTSNRIW